MPAKKFGQPITHPNYMFYVCTYVIHTIYVVFLAQNILICAQYVDFSHTFGYIIHHLKNKVNRKNNIFYYFLINFTIFYINYDFL